MLNSYLRKHGFLKSFISKKSFRGDTDVMVSMVSYLLVRKAFVFVSSKRFRDFVTAFAKAPFMHYTV